ncbi:hypothetical protein BC830DRAFT_1169106 [Chytriomyces sp. MP71]|nr:hypothetical protein BC830DRAFT_1169106 [Chytriomyces sp. MP71]
MNSDSETAVEVQQHDMGAMDASMDKELIREAAALRRTTQNRLAQRAYRARKDNKIRELELRVAQLLYARRNCQCPAASEPIKDLVLLQNSMSAIRAGSAPNVSEFLAALEKRNQELSYENNLLKRGPSHHRIVPPPPPPSTFHPPYHPHSFHPVGEKSHQEFAFHPPTYYGVPFGVPLTQLHPPTMVPAAHAVSYYQQDHNLVAMAPTPSSAYQCPAPVPAPAEATYTPQMVPAMSATPEAPEPMMASLGPKFLSSSACDNDKKGLLLSTSATVSCFQRIHSSPPNTANAAANAMHEEMRPQKCGISMLLDA